MATATIKINREELIKTLTAKIKEMEEVNKQFEKANKAFQKAFEDWQKKVVSVSAKQISKATNFRCNQNWRTQGVTNIDFDMPSNLLPAAPERDNFFTDGLRAYGEYEIKEVRQFVRMLEMAQNDAITMSALKNVSQYL